MSELLGCAWSLFVAAVVLVVGVGLGLALIRIALWGFIG